jgi:predicted amidohydrolase YtcJ
MSVDVLGTKSIDELQNRLRDFISTSPNKSGWISGSGWDQQSLGRYPTRHDLDTICSDRPVVLWRVCFHLCVVNTMALKLAGIDNKTIDPTGGVIDRENDGTNQPNGILRESANGIISTLTKVDSDDERLAQYHAGLQRCLESGLTVVQTNDEDAWPIYSKLHDQGRLPIRVYLTIMHEERHKPGRPKPGQVHTAMNQIGESLLSCDRVKIFSDGCLGAHTAAMSTPYLPPPAAAATTTIPPSATSTTESAPTPPTASTTTGAVSDEKKVTASGSTSTSGDAPSPSHSSHDASCAHDTRGGHKPTLGVLIHEPDVLKTMIRDAHNEGWRLEVHAIGDRAAQHAIEGFEEARVTSKARGVLTHCQFLRDDLVKKMSTLGIVANVQPQFVVSDWKWCDATVAPSLMGWAYAWSSLLKNGVHVAGGSDSPVELPLPFKGMFDAIYRPIPIIEAKANGIILKDGDIIDELSQRWRSHECLTTSQALHLYTQAAAYAANVDVCFLSIFSYSFCWLLIIDALMCVQ